MSNSIQPAREKSGRELLLEEFNRSANLRFEAVQRFHESRFALIWRRYVDGVMGVDVDVLGAEPYRIHCQINMDGKGDAIESAVGESRQRPVLVWVGNVAEGFRPLDSLVRLERLDHVDVPIRHPLQVTVFNSDEISGGIDNRELRAVLDLGRIVSGQFKDNVVQGCSHVVDHIADYERQHGIKVRDLRQDDNYLVSVVLSDKVLLAALLKGANEGVGLGKVTICPFEPELSAPYEG